MSQGAISSLPIPHIEISHKIEIASAEVITEITPGEGSEVGKAVGVGKNKAASGVSVFRLVGPACSPIRLCLRNIDGRKEECVDPDGSIPGPQIRRILSRILCLA